jgi:hypothetical protein
MKEMFEKEEPFYVLVDRIETNLLGVETTLNKISIHKFDELDIEKECYYYKMIILRNSNTKSADRLEKKDLNYYDKYLDFHQFLYSNFENVFNFKKDDDTIIKENEKDEEKN